MRKLKKILAMTLIIFITLETVGIYNEPMIANAMTKNEYDQKINAFINDYRWRNGVGWDGNKTPLISPHTSWGCCAYVNDFVKYVYGKNSQNEGATYTGVSNIQTGDVLYIYNSSWGEHWIVVLSRDGNSLYTAEGNVYENGSYKVRISGTQYQISGDALNSNYVGRYTLTRGYHYDTIVYNPQVDYMNLYVDFPVNGAVVKGKQLEIWGWSQYKKYENDPLIGANITASINGKTYNIPALDHLLEDKLPRYWTFLPEGAIKGGKNTITVTASYNGIKKSETKTFTVTTPSISNVEGLTKDILSNPYCTVTCNVSDDTEVSYVDFKIWTEANGEDDVEWQKAYVNSKTGTASCKIYKNKHKNEKGKYKVTIYAHRTETVYGENTYNFTSLFIYPLKNISLNKTAMSINIGKTENLSVNYNPSYTTDNKSVTWSSNKPQIATVSNTGQVTAKAKGTAVITAKVGNYSASCTVTVNDIIPTGISLDKTNLTLTSKDETATLKATVTPNDAKDKSVKWSTDNPAVATVDGNGKVIAVGNGTATITATTNSGAKSAKCVVTVNIIPTGISLDKTNLTLTGKNETATLKETVTPNDAKDKSVKWSTDSPAVATVDGNGKVTAVGNGTATITVTTNSGDKSAACVVTVNIVPTEVSLDKTNITLTGKNETVTLKATVTPNDAKDKSVKWSTDSPAVATVDENGKVTAVGNGTATITATTNSGAKSAKCVVTVNIIPTGISLDKTNLTLTGKNETATLKATVTPNDAKDKSVKWSTDNPAVATVDGNGKVTAVGNGTATITVTTNSGDKSAACVVTVNIVPTEVSLDKTNITLTGKNETVTLKATVTPNDAKDKSVKWSTDNPAVATVDGNGKVTAVGNGTATITATTNSGHKNAACVVTVSIQNKIMLGDVNNDGSINIQDAVILKKYLAEVLNLNINKTVSDINNDGKIDISDAVILLKRLAGMVV